MDPAIVQLVVQAGHRGAKSERSTISGNIRLVWTSRAQMNRLFISHVLSSSTSSGGIDAGAILAVVSCAGEGVLGRVAVAEVPAAFVEDDGGVAVPVVDPPGGDGAGVTVHDTGVGLHAGLPEGFEAGDDLRV